MLYHYKKVKLLFSPGRGHAVSTDKLMVVDGHDEETRVGDDAPEHRAVEGIILARRAHLCTSWGLPQIVKKIEIKVKRMSNTTEVSRYERKSGK